MATKAGDSDESTGFSQPLKSSYGKWKPPPRKHCIAQVTGGLGEIYTKIESGGQNADEDFSKCINEDNFFQPNSKGGLMAGRYQVIRVLGRGNSSTILQAQDTFRPGLYEVAIKVLKPEYFSLGYQESHLIAELNKADSHNFCGIVKLLNTFTLGSFFCMTFELLRPYPLHQVFKKIADKTEKLVSIRKVALRMLQILGFLGQQNVIHADLKPENILCNSENISDGIKVIDFGNAIHGVYEELSLYYDEFELQTLLYRAPEVLFGLPFGQEIDMWSLGCILAELYLGKPLFWAKQKKDLLTQMTSLFGPLPTKVYQRAKFFTHFKESVGMPLSFMDNFSKFGIKLDCSDFKFVSFLQGMLTFDPSERMSVSEAIQHPFMAPEMAIKYVLPFKMNGSEASGTYSPVDLTPSMYTHAPAGTLDSRNKHLTSLELLHQGTRDSSSTTKQKVIHVVAPFEPRKSKDTETAGVKVEPKSEPGDGGVEHGEGVIDGVRLPDAPVMTKSLSSEHQHPEEPILKEDTTKRSKQSLKIQKKPLKKPGDGDVEHGEGMIGGVQLPEALREAIKKPSVRSVRMLKKQDPPLMTKSSSSEHQHSQEPVLKEDTSKRSKQSLKIQKKPLKKPGDGDVEHGERMIGGVRLPEALQEATKKSSERFVCLLKKLDTPVMTKRSSSEHQHPEEPILKEDTSKRSKQSLKIQKKPLISKPVAQVESDSKPCLGRGKEKHLSGVRKLIDSPKADDPLTPDQTLKKPKGSAAKSKLNISEERTSAPDAKSEGTPGSPGESSHQFRYLKQQNVAAVSHKSKSLGVNMKKLRKTPVKLPEKSPASNFKRKRDRCKGTSESTSDVRKSDCSLDSKGMLICDEKKSVHPKKDVTLMVERVQKKKGPRTTSKGKSEDPLKGYNQKSSTSSTGHKQLKHQKRTSVYDFIVTPETPEGKRSGSRKRSLQMAGDSVVKRSRRKRAASGSDVNAMKAHPVDDSLGSSGKCLLEAWNSPSPEMKQSEARVSSSSKPSSEPTSLTSKMSVLSRLQAAGDNKTVKHSVPLPSVASSSSSSSSSRPLSAKSSFQSFKRWSLESSPLQPDQPTKTVVRSVRKRGAKAAHEHSPGTPKRKRKAKTLPPSPSSSESLLSPVGMPSLLQLSSPSSSSSSHPLPSKCVTKPRIPPVKQYSPALQIRRLFTGASSSRAAPSPQQWRKASPNVQSQRTDIKATEAELQDQLSDEEDEILLL